MKKIIISIITIITTGIIVFIAANLILKKPALSGLLSGIKIETSDNIEYSVIPGTKVSIQLPDNFYRQSNSNLFLNNEGASFSVFDIEAPVKNVIEDFQNNKIENQAIGSTFKTGSVIEKEIIDDNTLFISFEGIQRNLPVINFIKVTGNEKESVNIIGVILKKSHKNKIKQLKNSIRDAVWRSDAKRNFEEIIFYQIPSSQSFVLTKFFYDRFVYTYAGQKKAPADSIDVHIGSYTHNYKINKSNYSDAASAFSFRPPFIKSSIQSLSNKRININGLDGIELKFIYKNEKNELINGYSYILFNMDKIYFLRAEIKSAYPDYYLKSIRDIFNGFKLI